MRMCIGCRERSAKAELLRMVWATGTVAPDPRQDRPGRGAYLHPRVRCLDAAVRKRAIGRALRVAGAAADLTEVRATLSERPDWA
jgi:uncharacterized protein